MAWFERIKLKKPRWADCTCGTGKRCQSSHAGLAEGYRKNCDDTLAESITCDLCSAVIHSTMLGHHMHFEHHKLDRCPCYVCKAKRKEKYNAEKNQGKTIH
jgi:hypothetical protein